MDIVIIFGSLALAVAVLSFLSGRRYGVLAMSLATGAVIADLWGNQLTQILASYGTQVANMPIGVAIEVALLALPLVMAFFSGIRIRGLTTRIISAIVVGLMFAAFLVEPLGGFMELEGDSQGVYHWLAGVWQYIVTIGLILAVVDMLLSRNSTKKH